jgi:hypothetical protein
MNIIQISRRKKTRNARTAVTTVIRSVIHSFNNRQQHKQFRNVTAFFEMSLPFDFACVMIPHQLGSIALIELHYTKNIFFLDDVQLFIVDFD